MHNSERKQGKIQEKHRKRKRERGGEKERE
jgi:hypothetical protein